MWHPQTDMLVINTDVITVASYERYGVSSHRQIDSIFNTFSANNKEASTRAGIS